jgi:hypothetical protein
MEKLLQRYGFLRAADGAGGGGADGGGAGGGAGGGDQPPAWLPKEMPEAYRGATPEETLGKLFGGFNEVNTRAEGLRTQLARLPKPPEKPELYTYDPSDKLKPYFGDIAKNPVFDTARKAAHARGFSQEQFAGFIEDVYAPLAEQGILGKPFDGAAEVKTFMTEAGIDATAAGTELTNLQTFANGLFGQLKGVPDRLKDDVKAELLGLTDTAAGNFLLKALSGRLGEAGIRIAGEGAAAGEISEADLKKLDADPRIDPNNREHTDPAKRFDPDLRRRYDEAYRKLQPANKTAW